MNFALLKQIDGWRWPGYDNDRLPEGCWSTSGDSSRAILSEILLSAGHRISDQTGKVRLICPLSGLLSLLHWVVNIESEKNTQSNLTQPMDSLRADSISHKSRQ